MTKKELINALNEYPDDMYVVIAGDNTTTNYECSDVDMEYDEDYEKDVIILYS